MTLHFELLHLCFYIKFHPISIYPFLKALLQFLLSQSSFLLTRPLSIESSTNFIHVHLLFALRSLMEIPSKISLKNNSKGSPFTTSLQPNISPSSTTNWHFVFNMLFTHLTVLALIPIFYSLFYNLPWAQFQML